MTQYPIKATHAILVGGLPRFLEFEQGAELTTALILPGDLVQFTSAPNDCSVKAAIDNSQEVIGVANIHPVGAVTPPRGGTRTVAYQEGDSIEVINGPITVMLRIATSEDIQCGEMVQPAASGEVKAYVCGTDTACDLIAQALETNTADTTAFQWGLFQLRMG